MHQAECRTKGTQSNHSDKTVDYLAIGGAWTIDFAIVAAHLGGYCRR